MRPFLVCIHDASPRYERETRMIIRDLVPLVGRRLSFAVVPDWRGSWPLEAHPAYCRLVAESSDELLLHGYFHQRGRGRGVVSVLAHGSDEMSGLDPAETVRTLERGQHVFRTTFGQAAHGFLAPAWQRGGVTQAAARAAGLRHTLGFFSLDSSAGRRIPLATWTWDCGRWPALGHLGHALGRFLHSLDRGVPVLAIHPRDPVRGFWPAILGVVEELLEAGYAPSTPGGLLEASC